MSDGEDIRKLPLSLRKANLSRLLARRVDGIFLSDFEQGKIGPDLFRHACLLGQEGLVSKHRERPYRAGRCNHWVKVKNRQHPAFSRVQDAYVGAQDPAVPLGLGALREVHPARRRITTRLL